MVSQKDRCSIDKCYPRLQQWTQFIDLSCPNQSFPCHTIILAYQIFWCWNLIWPNRRNLAAKNTAVLCRPPGGAARAAFHFQHSSSPLTFNFSSRRDCNMFLRLTMPRPRARVPCLSIWWKPLVLSRQIFVDILRFASFLDPSQSNGIITLLLSHRCSSPPIAAILNLIFMTDEQRFLVTCFWWAPSCYHCFCHPLESVFPLSRCIELSTKVPSALVCVCVSPLSVSPLMTS